MQDVLYLKDEDEIAGEVVGPLYEVKADGTIIRIDLPNSSAAGSWFPESMARELAEGRGGVLFVDDFEGALEFAREA